jgi:hypothetical protein
MRKKLIDIVGWYGVAAILAAYAFLNFELMNVRDISYQLLNLTGAFGIILEAWYKKDYEPVVLNLVWLAIALVAIIRSI